MGKERAVVGRAAAAGIDDLKRLANVLRSSEHAGDLLAASRELHDLLVRATGLDAHAINGADAADIMLPSGKAVSSTSPGPRRSCAAPRPRCMRPWRATRNGQSKCSTRAAGHLHRSP
jgi:hypothetical protein